MFRLFQSKRYFQTISKLLLKNREIRHSQIQLISLTGVNEGIVSLEKVLASLDLSQFELVQVSDKIPPVCKIISKKEQYQKKRDQAQTKKPTTKLKELEMNTNIGVGDLNTKLNKLKDFISKGNPVKITLVNRGERKAPEMYKMILEQVDCIQVNSPTQQGKKLMFTLKPK